MRKILFFFLIVTFLMAGVDASFSYKNNTLIKQYSEGDTIRGLVNISFSNEPASKMFTSNFPGNITLLEILKNSGFLENRDFECTTNGCLTDYSANGEINQLPIEEEGNAGFLVSGNINSISSASFRVTSDKGPSCFGQVIVDVLGNKEHEIINTAYTSTKCGIRNYGCFSGGNEEATINANPYCEKISLPAGPAYSIGARIINSTTVEGNLKMDLYNDDWTFLGSCILPRNSQQTQDLECVVEYPSAAAQDYFLCVKAENSQTRYKIKLESQNACGCSGVGCQPGTSDFEIFGQQLQFGDVDFIINDSTFSKVSNSQLKDYMHDYLLDKYAGECSDGCTIPVSFYGGQQTLSFSNILIEYFADNILKSTDKIYDVELEEPKIDSQALNLDIEEAGFVIPDNTNERNFKLNYGGQQVFSENINITDSFGFTISPRFVSIGITTSFEATGFSGNVTNSTWDFGDGAIVSSQNNKANHRYTEEGDFDIKVTLNKNNLTSTRTFSIKVGNAEEAANITIEDYRERLSRIRSSISSYPSWIKPVIENELDLNSSENRLNELEEQYEMAESDDNFTEVMLGLIDLNIPRSVNTSRSGLFPLTIGFENIDVSYIEEISSGDAGNSKELKDAIVAWMSENFDGSIEREEISAFYDEGSEPLLNRFSLDIIPKTNNEAYLIIGYSSQGLLFQTDYNDRALEGGVYIPVDSGRRKVEFVIVNDISPEELGVYISPLISELDYDSTPIREAEEGGFSWRAFIIGIIVLLIIAFIVYIALQEWYKRNYESSLFKSEDDLYNLINFIHNARNNGLSDGQIRLKLKQSKWSGEQITYAIKKLDGKRTGMFEIPIFGFLERKKVREEIEKRNKA